MPSGLAAVWLLGTTTPTPAGGGPGGRRLIRSTLSLMALRRSRQGLGHGPCEPDDCPGAGGLAAADGGAPDRSGRLGEIAAERGVGKGELPRAVVEGILRECLRPIAMQLDRPAA